MNFMIWVAVISGWHFILRVDEMPLKELQIMKFIFIQKKFVMGSK